ncbi:MAG: DUF99 family protein [Nanoarchaeota archaeon]|nr:DUF99 family protein [Nanoarchaeota archaeon]MBU1322248.1 DUF99 family protein [Nanoarchaeota archaeon]MBU1598228.1 DUF99 family protein [Nanoarchaeota archaeon]MBU2441981.1 DUF99 family protein [Nanoarchaeota archaeon]
MNKLKKELRVLGIADTCFDKFDPLQKYVRVVATLFRGGNFMDGLLSCNVKKDGEDATLRIIEMVKDSKFRPQIQAIFLKGIAVAGFNVINPVVLNKELKIPVIIVIRDHPDYKKIFAALKGLRMDKKIDIIKKMPKPVKIDDIYVQHVGINLEDTKKLLKITCTHSNLPEPIRVAHLIASGLSEGQS